jgi:hypothetical protein
MNFIGLLPPDLTTGYRAQLLGLMERCASEGGNGEFTAEDMVALVESGEAFCVVEIDHMRLVSAVILRRIDYPRKSVLHISFGSGRNVRKLLPTVRLVADALGISTIETQTRPAVAKLYKKEGFTQAYVISRLEL